MGKLHSLRKQIQKQPEEWYMFADMSETIFGKIPLGAIRMRNGWVPVSKAAWGGRNPNSYAMFVRKVLWDLGIKTDKPRSVKNVYRWHPRKWGTEWE